MVKFKNNKTKIILGLLIFILGIIGYYIYMNQSNFSISDEDFFNMPIPTPCLEEQMAIGNLFYNLDKLISTQSRRIVSLKRIKSACLARMFVYE